MNYAHDLIHITTDLDIAKGMYSLVLLRANTMHLTLGGMRCFIDGCYLLCLSEDDTLIIHSGSYDAVNLHFLPYFYNVNLNHELIGQPVYDSLRARHGYPDFHLFRVRNEQFCGILSITPEEYEIVRLNFERARRNIDSHDSEYMWSCRTRSDVISILRIAESAYMGEQCGEGNEIIRYILDHIGDPLTLDSLCKRFNTNRTSLSRSIKALTGLSPMQYVLEERLNQSRPDLLFTDIPISEISLKYGFLDDNYYIRAFKKRFGKTPLQYRLDGRAARSRRTQ